MLKIEYHEIKEEGGQTTNETLVFTYALVCFKWVQVEILRKFDGLLTLNQIVLCSFRQ